MLEYYVALRNLCFRNLKKYFALQLTSSEVAFASFIHYLTFLTRNICS